MKNLDIFAGIALTAILFFIIYKGSPRKKIRTEVLFSKVYKSFYIQLLIFIPCIVLIITYSIWELLYSKVRLIALFRILPFSYWFLIPYKFVVTKDGFYYINSFKGSVLICTFDRIKNCSKNDKGNLIIELLNSENQIARIRIYSRFTDEDVDKINHLLVNRVVNESLS
jgi:hypothetical protein